MATTLKPHDKEYRLAYDELPDGTIVSTGIIVPSDALDRRESILGNGERRVTPQQDQNGHNMGPPDSDRIYDTRLWEPDSDEVEIYRYTDKSQALRNHDRLVDFHHPDFSAYTEAMLEEQEVVEMSRWEAMIEDTPNDTTDNESNDREDTESESRSADQETSEG